MSIEVIHPTFERRLMGASSNISVAIKEEIGRGGQGVVSLGMIGSREVAVKELKTGEQDQKKLAEARAALAHEANIHERVSNEVSEGIVRFGVFDTDVWTGEPFMVMQRMKGSIKPRKGGLSPDVALKVTGNVAQALAEMHKIDVIHRDVKPPNVMVDMDGDSVALGDLGLAYDLRSDIPLSGPLHGTFPYMSLDALKGANPIPAHDIHALGVTTYQLLTGKLPYYHNEKDTKIKYAAYVHDISSSEIPHLPSVTTNPLYDRELSIVVGNMLSKDIEAVLPAEDLANVLPQLAADIATAKTRTDILLGTVRSRMQQPVTVRTTGLVQTEMATSERTASMVPATNIIPAGEQTVGHMHAIFEASAK